MLNMFYPNVRQMVLDFTILLLFDCDRSNFSDGCVTYILQPKDALFKELLTADYIGAGEDRVKNRDGFTEIIGDMMFTLPAIKAANIHRGILFTQDNNLPSHTFTTYVLLYHIPRYPFLYY